jgi:hypothetical protein
MSSVSARRALHFANVRADTRVSGGALAGWLPLHAWSARRRAVVAVTLGAHAAALTAGACVATDLAGARAANSALAAAEAQLAAARQTLARLPALRRDAQDWPQPERNGSAAGDIRSVSELAAEAGLVLIALEPAASGGAKAQAFRATKLVAQGSFAQLRTFLEGLAELPELVVPAELVVRRSGAGLAVSAMLQVYDGLPAVAFAQDEGEGGAPGDPFTGRFAGAPGAAGADGEGGMRLVGMLAERGRVVALVETTEGTLAVQAGSTLAGARVESVDPTRVVLSLGGATQALTWQEDGK